MTYLMNVINLVAFVVAIVLVFGGIAMLVKWMVDEYSDWKK